MTKRRNKREIKSMLEEVQANLTQDKRWLLDIVPESTDLDNLLVDVNGVVVLLNAASREIDDVLMYQFDEVKQ